MRLNHVVIAVRGERLALARVEMGTADVSPGAPQDEFLQVYGIDEEGRIALQIWFDLEDMDAAMAELDAVHARFEEERSQAPAPFRWARTPFSPNAARNAECRARHCMRTSDRPPRRLLSTARPGTRSSGCSHPRSPSRTAGRSSASPAESISPSE